MANEMQANVMQKVAYHIEDGAKTMYAVDAQSAVQSHPAEWSWVPWPLQAAAEYRSKREAAHKAATDEAKAAGQPAPAPLPPPPPVPTEAEKAEMAADAKARADAAALVAAQDKKDEEARVAAEKVAAAKALLASPPPVPDPTARRPFGRPGEPTAAERDMMEKRAKAAADAKAKADAQAAAARPQAEV